jgi:hypothetical protein
VKEKKHRHKFSKVKEWITSPSHPNDVQRYYSFTVLGECECGITKQRYSEHSEVEDYIKECTCAECGTFDMFKVKHNSSSDCLKHLAAKVRFLEDRLEKLGDVLTGVI